jgi:predicted site-specific integrase-resolvase
MNLAAWAERNGVARVTRTVVEHRDRFCRLVSEYVRTALLAHGRELVVVDSAEVGDDLVRDMTEILTSMCARLTENTLRPTASGMRWTPPPPLTLRWRDGAL